MKLCVFRTVPLSIIIIIIIILVVLERSLQTCMTYTIAVCTVKNS